MVAEYEADGAHTIVIVEKPSGHELRRGTFYIARLDQGVFRVAGPHWRKKNLARSCKTAADDEEARVDDGPDRRQTASGSVARIFKQALEADIASLRRLNEIRHCNGASQPPLSDAQHRRATAIKLKTTAIAATAEIAVRVEHHMAELSGRAGNPGQHLAVCNNGTADAEIKLEEHEVFGTRGGAPHHLSKRRAIAFVVGKNGLLQYRFEGRAQIDTIPARQQRAAHDAAIGGDGSRHGKTDTEQAGKGQAVFLVNIVYRLFDGPRRLFRSVISFEWYGDIGNDVVGHIGKDDANFAPTEQNAETGARLGIE